jgi:hypothetical protein
LWNEGLGLWCLMPLFTIFQLYRGGQFLLVEETGENHRPVTDKLCHIMLYWVDLPMNHEISQHLIKYQRLSRACIVHLVIKRTNWSYVKTMSCSGSHLGITINIQNTKFVKDLPMIDAQFRFNQCNSFRVEYISVFSTYGPVLILYRCQPLFGAISNKKLRCQ